MRLVLICIAFFIVLLLVISSFMINIFPPNDKEFLGTYHSYYDEKNYYLILDKARSAKFIVKSNNNVIYEDICKKYELENVRYRVINEYRITFLNCKDMDSSAILNRTLDFDILIGNNGMEEKRIDPDENIFYRKVH